MAARRYNPQSSPNGDLLGNAVPTPMNWPWLSKPPNPWRSSSAGCCCSVASCGTPSQRWHRGHNWWTLREHYGSSFDQVFSVGSTQSLSWQCDATTARREKASGVFLPRVERADGACGRLIASSEASPAGSRTGHTCPPLRRRADTGVRRYSP